MRKFSDQLNSCELEDRDLKLAHERNICCRYLVQTGCVADTFTGCKQNESDCLLSTKSLERTNLHFFSSFKPSLPVIMLKKVNFTLEEAMKSQTGRRSIVLLLL
jgi:hypothetical protein